MDLVSRLKQYLASQGITITQFADECDIPRPTASQLLAGRNKKVSDEIIGKIHYTYPALSVSWLMFGEGDMLTQPYSETSERQNGVSTHDFQPQSTDSQHIASESNNIFSVVNSESEKSTVLTPSSASGSSTNPSADSTVKDEFSFHERNTFTFSQPEPSRPGTTGISETPGASGTSDVPGTSGKSVISGTPSSQASHPITVMPDKGKCVTGIVVYYSDSTYQSFIPDPEGKHPFMR